MAQAEYVNSITKQINSIEWLPSSQHSDSHPLKNIMCFVGIKGVVRGIMAPGRFPRRDGSAASSRLEASKSERSHLSTTLSNLRPCCNSATSLAWAPADVLSPRCATQTAIWQEA